MACAGLGLAFAIGGTTGLQNAEAEGDTRTLTIHHTHSGEDITVTFKRQGRYDEDGLRRLNHFLRDWRTQDATIMDRRLFDIVWEVYREVGAREPIQIISAYRAPQTNAMLRRRSSGVARNSQHMLGHAMDFFIPNVPLAEIRNAGLRLQRGGVGFYPTSGSPFVHLDTGSIRHWPRMTHDQLARVFPDGKTVHIPTDGQPLARYALALAEINRRGDQPSTLSLASARRAGAVSDEETEAPAPVRFFARLLGRDQKAEAPSDEVSSAARPEARDARKDQPIVTADARSAVPLPRTRPAAVQVASLDKPVIDRSADKVGSGRQAVEAVRADGNNANDVIRNRGFWEAAAYGDIPTATTRARPAVVASRFDAIAAVSRAAGDEDASEPPQALGYAPSRETRDALAEAARKLAATAAQRLSPIPQAQAAVRTAALPAREAARTAVAELKLVAGPWLRTIIVTPSVSHFLKTAVMNIGDYRSLTPFLRKPQTAVAMTFSADPYAGMQSASFSGAATTFIPTISFGPATRTVALR